MTLLKATLPTDASEQKDMYNSSGPLVQSASYSPGASVAWAMIGLVMGDAFDPDADETALMAAIVALGGITSVPTTDSGSRGFYGQMPATIEAAAHEGILLCEATIGATVGFASNTFSQALRLVKTIKPPVNKQWVIVNCVLPAAFANDAAVTDLEAALEGLTGITTARVLLHNTVPATATDATVRVESRMRIDAVVV